MFKRLLFLVTALRAFRAGQPGQSTDPRMRMVMSAINAWRDARRSGSAGGGSRSTGAMGFVLDALRAFRASGASSGGASAGGAPLGGASSGGGASSAVRAIVEAVRAFRAARR